MHYAVLRLVGVRMAVVLVEKAQLQDKLVGQLQELLHMPVMLVARDDASWRGVRARAQFDPQPYLHALLASGDLDWSELPEDAERELPF